MLFWRSFVAMCVAQSSVERSSYFENQSHYPTIVSDGAMPDQAFPKFLPEAVQSQLSIEYGVGRKRLLFDPPKSTPYAIGSRKWLNQYATATGSDANHLHGKLGIDASGNKVYIPKENPGPVDSFVDGKEAATKIGGFYQMLSDALPLDRYPPDTREQVCKDETYDLYRMPDVSIIITHFNEPFSTLVRTIHSVLNHTPPELLTEIIVVDDGSDFRFGYKSEDVIPPDLEYGLLLRHYIEYLPKVKILSMANRRGLVQARLAGIRQALGEVVVILDSHIEVNDKWLEPQLKVLESHPKALVVPQILGLSSETFEYSGRSGIGCQVTYKWGMNEQSSLTEPISTAAPIRSPVIAGGLFAIYKDWFWEMGGFDEEFSMWGSENVEIGFRMWMCGGEVLCAPCARTYHIYRKNGSGYSSPPLHITKNKARTAKLWTDDHYDIAEAFISPPPDLDLGSFEKMNKFKAEKKCKPFTWFKENIAGDPNLHKDLRALPTNSFTSDSIIYAGEFKIGNWCLDTMQKRKPGETVAMFPCHGQGGTQNWLIIKLDDSHVLMPSTNESFCIVADGVLTKCDRNSKKVRWSVVGKNNLLKNEYTNKCMTWNAQARQLTMTDCTQAEGWSIPEIRKKRKT